MDSKLTVTWHPDGRTAQHPPNPAYPDGCHVDFSEHATPSCTVLLPYPAEACGIHRIACETCALYLGVTAAGRVDDPRAVTLPCGKRPVVILKTAWRPQ